MNVGVVTIDFDDIGLLNDGHNFGHFTGTAEIDCDGEVIALCIETIDRGAHFWHVNVPETYDPGNWVCMLADNVKGTFKSTIKDKLDDWSVEIAESSFRSDREEHSTLRAVRGRMG